MKPDDFDFIGNFSTTGAVFLGAILATMGGLAATQLEWYFERKRRARHAALFFGEVLSTLGVILKIAHDTYGRGDPFGPITMRMLRSARSEIEIYERNRETLYELHDAAMRARIHTLILRVNTPLEGVFDATEEIRIAETQLKSPDLPATHREELQARLESLLQNRATAYEFVMEMAGQIKPITTDLAPLARQSFDGIDRAPF